LLDDPLSAVDPAVANSIYNDCIRNALKDKLVILVTHQLQFLRSSERILVLQDGKQAMIGTFDEITKKGFNVEEILQTYNQAKNDPNTQPSEAALKRAFNRSATLNLFRASTLNQAAAKLALQQSR